SQDYTVKWRPVLFDMDFGARRTTGSNLSAYFTPEGIPSKDGSLTNMDIYVGLQKNAAWREKFAERYVYVVVNHLNRERLLKIFDEYYAALKPEMERHIKRWGAPSSMSVWEKEVASMRSILEQRPDNILKSVQSYFGISDAKMQEYKQQALLPENNI
ncbi:MAG: CotH kinase family protein, partial [Clostridia bacterium]|nr:CotH kinase family protein [Clostridia bacterium]